MLADTKKIALLIDIDNVSIDPETLGSILAQVEVFGEIAYAKFYGYNDRKHKDLDEIINGGAYEVAQRMRFKKRNKSELDIRIFIDAIKMACLNPSIDAFCIVGGAGDFVPLISALKSLGKFVIGGFENNEENCAACHQDLGLKSASVKIQKVEPIKVPKIEEPKKTVSSEVDMFDSLNLDSILKTTEEPEDKNFDMNDALKQIQALVSEFKEINND